jgi:hypothetical protein
LSVLNALLCGLIIAAAFVGCSKPQETVELRNLKELGVSQVAPLSKMLNEAVEVVCVLGIYQTQLRDDGPFRDRVNALLTKANFGIFGKGTWYFVFVLGDSVSLQKIEAYRDQLHLMTDDAGLPSTFKPVECTTVDRARIMKVRESVIGFGEER